MMPSEEGSSCHPVILGISSIMNVSWQMECDMCVSRVFPAC
jgi:hypothetical protein